MEKFAAISIILGTAGILTSFIGVGFFLALPAVVMGLIAASDKNARGAALAGAALGIIGAFITAVLIFYANLYPYPVNGEKEQTDSAMESPWGELMPSDTLKHVDEEIEGLRGAPTPVFPELPADIFQSP